jgi:hypothetical protein
MLLTACPRGTVLPTMARVTVPPSSRPHPAARARAATGPPAAESQQFRPPIHDVTITIDAEHPGPVVPGDFAGLSFERQALNSGNAGVTGRLFMSANNSLVTLFRNLGVRSLRIGGSTVDWLAPAGAAGNYAPIDSLFAFAAAAGAKVIYTLRLFSPAADPAGDLKTINAEIAGYIWRRWQRSVANFAFGNEPDWHAFHTYEGHPWDPAVYEETSGVPGTAYASYLAHWQSFADAVAAAAPGASLSGPDAGAYSTMTFTPDPDTGVSWTEQLVHDEKVSGRIAVMTQHYYVGGEPNAATAQQAIGNMLSSQWVNDSSPGAQPGGTAYTPYPWLYTHILGPVRKAGLPYRLTESNDYLIGVPGASNAFASALWALDFLHWWAAHGAAGVNFHNKQWLPADVIVPAPAASGERYVVTPKGYGIKAFTLGSAGTVKPTQIGNPASMNLTAYCISGAGEDYVTIINKTQGAEAADAAVTILPYGPGVQGVEIITLASTEPGDATAASALLGGASITGDSPWQGTWSTLPTDPQAGIRVTVSATTAVILRIPNGG